ncbi:GNAT family N-acetyltransferase [Candidatus Hydrogenedentota bacterium]
MNIETIDYANHHQEEIRALFKKIYPDRPTIADQMGYDVETARHVTTKLAIIGGKIVGQAGIFYLKDEPGVAGMGWHVHPEFHGRGIGTLVAEVTLAEAKRRGVTKMAIQAAVENVASIALAKKLGFRECRDVSVPESNAIRLTKEL